MILLIRHGETAGNVSKANYIDMSDEQMALTDVGRSQIVTLSGMIGPLLTESDAWSLAPEPRCRESSAMLGCDEQSNATVDKRLRAQSWGDLRFPGARAALEASGSWPSGLDVRFPGGETAREVLDRCRQVADELRVAELNSPCRVHCVVTHGVVIRVLLAHWGGWSDERIESTPSVPPGSCLRVERDVSTDGQIGVVAKYRPR